jgi:NADPH:quinone reductase
MISAGEDDASMPADWPATMTAAQIVEWGKAPVLRTVPTPHRPPGHTLLRVRMASVTQLDLSVASGEFGIRPQLPYTGGTEGIGAVVASDRFAVGERLSLRGESLGLGDPGCWAQYVTIPDEDLCPAPALLDDEIAATYFDPGTAAWSAVHEVGRLTSGETALIGGAAGAVGSIAAQLALLAGARKVYGEISAAARAADLPAGVEPVVTGEGTGQPTNVDLLIDTVGGLRLERSLALVRPGGRVVLVGYTAGEKVHLDLPRWLLSDVALLPLNMLRRADAAARSAETVAALLADGSITLNTSVFALTELPPVFAALRAGQLRARAVVTPG